MPSSSSLFCDHCGAANRAQALFCRACGRHFAMDEMVSMSSTLTGLLDVRTMLRQRYIVLGRAGQGGFGAVYKASDTQLGGRLVAIKEMSQSSLKLEELIEATESFNREAMLLASLKHPNLPHIYEQFTENARSYLVMDFIDGETLETRLQRLGGVKLPIEQALSIALQLCSVLEYLHTRQPPVIFRDLKPGNVMITASGHVFLIDFGIARNFKPGQEKDTKALGSYGYAPPEQYGKSQTTTRADIYSLGATLHQLITGENPSETPFQFTPLRLSDPMLARLNTLVMDMVNVDINKRPARIDIVRQELQNIATSYAQSSILSRSTINVAAKSSLPSLPSLTSVPQNSTISAPYTYLSPAVQKGARKRTARPVAQAQMYPQANLLYMSLGHTGRITQVAWSPDGKYIASASYDKTVRLWDAASGQHVRTYKGHSARVNGLAWSSTSKLITTASDDKTVRIWHVAQDAPTYIFNKHQGPVNAVTWSPDGTSIASAGDDKIVRVWHASAAYDVWSSYREHTDIILTMAWSPDGQYIASGGKDHSVKIWEPEKIQQKRSFWSSLFSSNHGQISWGGHTGQIYFLAWSPDSKQLASACSDYRVRIRNVYTESLLILPGVDASTIKNTVTWSPDGQYLALGGNDKAVHIWNSTTRKETFTYYGHTGYVMSVAWSPDGSRIASAGVDRTIQVWQAV